MTADVFNKTIFKENVMHVWLLFHRSNKNKMYNWNVSSYTAYIGIKNLWPCVMLRYYRVEWLYCICSHG